MNWRINIFLFRLCIKINIKFAINGTFITFDEIVKYTQTTSIAKEIKPSIWFIIATWRMEGRSERMSKWANERDCYVNNKMVYADAEFIVSKWKWKSNKILNCAFNFYFRVFFYRRHKSVLNILRAVFFNVKLQ